MGEELKPCPFCGGEPLVYKGREATKLWKVVCKNCDAGPSIEIGEQAARDKWNRRALSAAGPVVWTRQRSLDRLKESGMLIAISGPGGDGYEVPLYATPPASGLREENERLRTLLSRTQRHLKLFEGTSGYRDGEIQLLRDVSAALQTEGK